MLSVFVINIVNPNEVRSFSTYLHWDFLSWILPKGFLCLLKKLFLCVKPYLEPWNEAHFVTIYTLLNDLFYSICQYLLENFCTYILLYFKSFPTWDVRVLLASRNLIIFLPFNLEEFKTIDLAFPDILIESCNEYWEYVLFVAEFLLLSLLKCLL